MCNQEHCSRSFAHQSSLSHHMRTDHGSSDKENMDKGAQGFIAVSESVQ